MDIAKPTYSLTPQHLAARWNMHHITIHKLYADGKIPPPFKVGSSLRWRLDVIEEFERQSEKAIATRVAEAIATE